MANTEQPNKRLKSFNDIVYVKDDCTFKRTGREYMVQKWAPCFDCFGQNDQMGACQHCLETCHKGHKIGILRESKFFCDCGAENRCETLKLTNSVPPNSPSFPTNYCGTKVPSPSSTVPTNATEDFYKSCNTLSKKLCDVLERESVHSPLSIAYVLTLLHYAARETTREQLCNLMERENVMADLFDASNVFNSDIVRLANAIIVNKDAPVNEQYLFATKNLALVSNEDFSDVTAIVNKANKFIENGTNGLIKDILKKEMINDQTLMILINTLYFKTVWDKQFKKKNSKKEKFNNGPIVPMMTNTAKYPYLEDEQMQMVELPYKGKQFAMGFVLPRVGVDMAVCKDYLTRGKEMSSWEKIEVHIPKFTQRKNIDLIPMLKKLGVTHLFDKRSKLDGMLSDPEKFRAWVSTMIHEAVVIVDEEGTEAAATTVAVVQYECLSIERDPIVFYANRPFVYYIKHLPTDTLLFVGDYHGN